MSRTRFFILSIVGVMLYNVFLIQRDDNLYQKYGYRTQTELKSK